MSARDKKMKNSRLDINVPWITKEGHLDPSKFPIDGVLKQTLSKDLKEFHGGCNILQTMHEHDRPEAGVYLLGLLRHYQDDLERLTVIVKNLRGFRTAKCADALFAELLRVKSSNTTRRYLNSVMGVLSHFPREMVEERFYELAADKSFSYKMRKKFRDIAETGYYQYYGY